MSIYAQLEDIFHTVFNDDTIILNADTTAADVEGWDSLAHINLILSIEQSFGVQFTNNELTQFNNLGALVDLLELKGVA